MAYAVHDGETLTMDWYSPSGSGTFPAVVAVHGGGWQAGSKAAYRSMGEYLAQRGYVLVSVRYRFSAPGKKSYPQAVHDVRAAVQFVKANAAMLKVDPARIALAGASAGAHLAALVALAGDDPQFASGYPDDPQAKQSTRVRSVVGLVGVYDLAAQWNHDQLSRPFDQITEKFLGAKLTEDRRVYFEASPLSYATEKNNATSFFLAWGTEDDIADVKTQSEAFLLALKQARFNVRSFVLPGANHWFGEAPFDEPGSYNALLVPPIMRFLERSLK